MGSSRFRSIFCGPNYVSPGLNRPCFAVSSGAVRARVHAHEHASKSTRSEHRSRGLRGGRVTAKYHQREREKKFHRTNVVVPFANRYNRPFNVSSIFLLQNKSISVFLSEKLIHFLSFFFFYSSRNSDLDPSRYCLHDGEKERVILTEVAGL